MKSQINGTAFSSQRVNRDIEHFKVFILFNKLNVKNTQPIQKR